MEGPKLVFQQSQMFLGSHSRGPVNPGQDPVRWPFHPAWTSLVRALAALARLTRTLGGKSNQQ